MRLSTRTLALGVALAVTSAGLRAQAAQAPDYSGRWVLAVARSDFGPQPAPASGTLTVRQAGTSLRVSTTIVGDQGTHTDSLAYVIGGPAITHEVANVGPSSTTVAWDGGVLVFQSAIKTQGIEIPVTSRWTLAPDGKTLDVSRAIGTPMGEMKVRMSFDRQP